MTKENWKKIILIAVVVTTTLLFNHSSKSGSGTGEGVVYKNPGNEVQPILSASTYDSIQADPLIGTLNATDSATNGLNNSGNSEVSAGVPTANELSNNENDISRQDVELKAGLQGLGFKKIRSDSMFDFQGAAAIVSDLETGEIYFDFNPTRLWPTASLTKLMTAATAMTEARMPETIELLNSDFAVDSPGGFFRAGDRYSFDDFLRGTLMTSSNAGSEALARIFGRENFLADMNNLAKEWGLQNTVFKDPTGLSISNQSTAYDLKEMVSKIYRDYSDILKMTRRSTWVAIETTSKRRVKFVSNNNFAGRADFLGGKTGYTEEANGNLVSIFSYSGRPIMVVVLGTNDRFGETGRLLNWFKSNYAIN
ncbi:MAG: serine hydrolase [Candidatus Paceibacterota bacterium]|jgi:D-alanyl-D-alanine carboxypeptidase